MDLGLCLMKVYCRKIYRPVALMAAETCSVDGLVLNQPAGALKVLYQ